MKQIGRIYSKYQKYIENFIFPLILVFYPLLKINQGIDVSDTTYSLGNFQYFGSMEGTWMVATFLANAAGSLLMHLPCGDTLIGMYFYTALFQSATALVAYIVLRRKIPARLVFLGEFMALGLCWCPSTILYNYLTYLLMTAGALLLYCGVLESGCTGRKGTPLGQVEGDCTRQMQPGNRRKQICLYVAAGICLGANVAVRMPNVVQMAFIVVVWYGAVLNSRKHRQTDCAMALSEKGMTAMSDGAPESDGAGRVEIETKCVGTEIERAAAASERAGTVEESIEVISENTNIPRQQVWKHALNDTLWCVLGYIIGFGIPFIAICIKYGVNAYPSMVRTMFAMTEKATDYKPASMVTGMFGDYITGLYWLVFAGVCIAAGWLLFKVQQRCFPEQSGVRILCGIGYAALLLVLLRFYWGKGMFSFRYYEYSSMYYPTVLLLLAAIAAGVYSLVRKEVCVQQKILAMIVLVQIFVTPLGSNNNLYPIMNNLFLVIPFVLWAGYGWLCTDDKKAEAGFAWKAPLVLLCLFVLVQSIGFHFGFVFQDGVQGESRTMRVTSPDKASNVYTGQDNGEMLQELAEYAEAEGLAGREVILYGELPGLGYLLDMPSALSTFWPDLDSYRMVEYRRDMALIEAKIKQDGAGAPVVILASPVAAYLSEDADAMNWFGVDQEALDGDEKLQMLDLFMKRYGYQEQFCNARYAVYVTEK